MADTHRTTTISTRITPELKARVEEFAAERCVGVVLVVERALTEYLGAREEGRGLAAFREAESSHG